MLYVETDLRRIVIVPTLLKAPAPTLIQQFKHTYTSAVRVLPLLAVIKYGFLSPILISSSPDLTSIPLTSIPLTFIPTHHCTPPLTIN
jgi:hypothetical protein